MSFLCEHWEALSTLLLSVVAIFIAIYSSRKTSKDATRQIESIKRLSQQTIENTTREIESVKELAKLQIKALAIELDMKMTKHKVLAQKANEERKEMNNIQSFNQTEARDMMMKNFQMDQPFRDLKYHSMYIQELRDISKRLEQLKETLN